MPLDPRTLLSTALGFFQSTQASLDVGRLRTWLDTRRGLGDLVSGVNTPGDDGELRQFPRDWRARYPTGTADFIVVASAWEATRWVAVQRAAWKALTRGR